MRKEYLVTLRYSDPPGGNVWTSRYKSRDVALARVAALFVEYPLADLDEHEREVPEGGGVIGDVLEIRMVNETRFTLTVDRQ